MAEKREMVLRAVMQILEEDYAGQPECTSRNDAQQWLAAFASAGKAGALDDGLFMQYLSQYLAGFMDPNLSFEASPEADWQPFTCGFSVRRFGDALYVTEVGEDVRLTLGDALVLLNESKPDEHLSSLIGNPVNGSDPERQLWDEMVARCAHVLVRHADGTEEDISIKRFPRPGFVQSLRPPTVEVLDGVGPDGNERAVVVRVHHFVDGSVLSAMQQHFDELAHARRVIIDVRDAEEGMIGNAYPLMALFFDREVNLKDLVGQEFVYTRYTQRNAHLRSGQLARLLDRSDASGREWVQAEIDHVAACAGQGFVKEAEFEEDMLFPPAPEGQQVFLLTDVRTRGAAERLAAIAERAAAQGCGKVRRVGRATRGGLDYANLIAVAFDEKFSLVYPISKTEAAHEGRGTLGQGIAPDVHVPFTSEECMRDLVLEAALGC
ncbi:MAG: S41 family peptidase [Gordonibacter sp.]